jgi:hypothetical protein
MGMKEPVGEEGMGRGVYLECINSIYRGALPLESGASWENQLGLWVGRTWMKVRRDERQAVGGGRQGCSGKNILESDQPGLES